MRSLPPDSVLIPLRSGALLVSPGHATFCFVPPESMAGVEGALASRAGVDPLADSLVAQLERHGFFGEPRPAPTVRPKVQLQLTNGCNLKCGYCCTDSGLARERELALDDWKEVVCEASRVFGEHVAFAILGGEPLFVPYALDLADFIVGRGLSLTLFTNGTPLADSALAARTAQLVRKGMILRVSLAGVTRASCDGHSGSARFDLAIAGLAELSRHGALAAVDLMLFPADVDEVATRLPELRWMLPAGTRVAMGLAFHGGREAGAHVFGSRAELESALDRVALEAGEAIAAPLQAPLANRREACFCALGQSLNVRSDGLLFSCFRMEEPAGHLSLDGFAKVAARLRENPRPASTFEPCAGCPLRSLCGGGCRSENLLLTGDPERPPCGPWRLQVLGELLAEDRVSCLEWPLLQLAEEARLRGIPVPKMASSAARE